ncbi:glutathionylspermidine synthase [Azospirillum soli]|nr:glutathionylspermidine synthase [Azospirillum soli]
MIALERIRTSPRPDWVARLEEIGFPFHTEADGTAYWDESAYWRFSLAEIETLEAAAEDVFRLCEQAVDHVIAHELYEPLGIPRWTAPAVEASWAARTTSDLGLYARFDFAWDGKGGPPKMLELNAETPTALYESAVVQWCWLQDCHPDADQFNSLEEALGSSAECLSRPQGGQRGRSFGLSHASPRRRSNHRLSADARAQGRDDHEGPSDTGDPLRRYHKAIPGRCGWPDTASDEAVSLGLAD